MLSGGAIEDTIRGCYLDVPTVAVGGQADNFVSRFILERILRKPLQKDLLSYLLAMELRNGKFINTNARRLSNRLRGK